MESEESLRDLAREAAVAIWEERGRSSLPTALEVRDRLNVGMNRIARHVKEWKDEQRKAKAASPDEDVPEELRAPSAAWTRSFWNTARRVAQKKFDAERAEWEAERADAAELLDQVSTAYDVKSAETERLAEENAAVREELAQRDERIAELEKRIATATEHRISAEAKAASAESLNTLLRDQLVNDQKRMSDALELMSKRKGKRAASSQGPRRKSKSRTADPLAGPGGLVQLNLEDGADE